MDQNLVAKFRRSLNSLKTSWFMVAVTAFGLIGCGGDDFKPELGLVSGTVTLNGAPAPDLNVTFEPQGEAGKKSMVGTSSTAVTDAQGKFELKYGGSGAKGAVVGKHVVRIESAAGGGPAGGANAAAPVVIPDSYNTKSTLKADVVAGNNPPVNFSLEVPKQ